MTDTGSTRERYVRSRSDRVLAGVCGGLADYLDVDPTLVRVLWVVVTLFSVGIGVVAYLLLWLLAPEDGEVEPAVREEDTAASQG